MTTAQNPLTPAHPPPGNSPAQPAKAQEPANLHSQSVAGEEDPGAALDMPPGLASRPASQSVSRPPGMINPGDEAAEGTPGTGESICRECGGSGRTANNPCPSCDGRGKVITAVGGA